MLGSYGDFFLWSDFDWLPDNGFATELARQHTLLPNSYLTAGKEHSPVQINGVEGELVDPAVQGLTADANGLPPAFTADKVAFVSLIDLLADVFKSKSPTHKSPHFADESGDLNRRKPQVAKAAQRTDSFPPDQRIQGQAAYFKKLRHLSGG
jgi:hypothetical protein